MSFVEFIGFVISVAAMIFLVIKRTYEERQRRKNPEEYARKEREREENLRKFLKERGVDVNLGEEREEKTAKKKVVALPAKKTLPPQKQQPVSQRNNPKPVSGYAGYSWGHDLKSAGSYEVIRVESTTRGNLVLQGLKSPRDMLIIKEIFDKPLSMR